jgi:MFS transporter, ACS family, glucarate transporter
VSRAKLNEMDQCQRRTRKVFLGGLRCVPEVCWPCSGWPFALSIYTFFQTWFHTFLVKGRGFSEGSLVFSALPYRVAAGANLTGRAASDALVRRLGLKWGRRSLGHRRTRQCVPLHHCGHGHWPAVNHSHPALARLWRDHLPAVGVFGVCLDIGRKHAGSMVGLMNTSAQVGGALSSVAYGYLVNRFRSYDAPFVPMAALLLLGSNLWFEIDASRELRTESFATPQIRRSVNQTAVRNS